MNRTIDLLREDAARQGLSQRQYARKYGFDLGLSRAAPVELSMSDLPDGAVYGPMEWGGGCDHPRTRDEEYRPGILRPFCTVCETFVGRQNAPAGEAEAFELREAA